MALSLFRPKASRTLTPVQDRVGDRMLDNQGYVTYRSGAAGQPLPLEKNGLLSMLVLHVTGTMAVTIPAAGPAPTLTALGPYGLIQSAVLQAGGGGAVDSASGYGLKILELAKHPAYTATYTAPLPGANAGTQAATTNEDWDFYITVPITVDERDLTGLLLLQNSAAAVYLKLQFGAETAAISLPANGTAAFTGSVSVDAVSFEVGAVTPADLAQLHVVEEIPFSLNSAGAKTRLHLPVGDVYQQILVMGYNNGQPDTTNAIGLSELDLNFGGYHKSVGSAELQAFLSNLYDRGNLPGGVWNFNFMRNRPFEYLDATNMPQLNLDLTFSAAPPSTAELILVTERLRKL